MAELPVVIQIFPRNNPSRRKYNNPKAKKNPAINLLKKKRFII